MASIESAGTYSRALATNLARLAASIISAIPVRHQRPAMRHVPGQLSVSAASRRRTSRIL